MPPRGKQEATRGKHDATKRPPRGKQEPGMKPTACFHVGTKGVSMMHQRLHAGLKKASRQHWGTIEASAEGTKKAPRGHQEGTMRPPRCHQEASKRPQGGTMVPPRRHQEATRSQP